MFFLFGNWKMYLGAEESHALSRALRDASLPPDLDVALFTNTLFFHEIGCELQGSAFSLGAQHIDPFPAPGAYTGAIGPTLFQALGARYALVGHSEHRGLLGESDAEVAKRVRASLEAGLTPVLCVGESRKEREEGARDERLKEQVESAFAGVSPEAKVLVAYEPLWAISKAGTGSACSREEAKKAHEFLQGELKKYFPYSVPMLYGGSVNEENISEYLGLDCVSGLLVGFASTKAESFLSLIRKLSAS